MAILRHNLGGMKMILKGSQISKGVQALRKTKCLIACHGERVAVLVSDL
jgi:hypothetical protein